MREGEREKESEREKEREKGSESKKEGGENRKTKIKEPFWMKFPFSLP